jgi:putative two-component system response regulator
MAAIDAYRRILIIDDDESIHADFRAVLACHPSTSNERDDSKRLLRGDSASVTAIPQFEIDSAYQGEAGLEFARTAKNIGRPYSLAFVDARTTAGWDGIETTRALLVADDALQVVLCTAHSDYLLEGVLREFAGIGRVMLLRKPFDIAEAWLLAISLTDKWRLTHELNGRLQRQSDQISTTRRVMSIIEGCLDELEQAHDELCGHAGLLAQRLQQNQVEIAGTRDLTMFALAQLADSRDPETGEHLLRMRAYAQLLAERLSRTGPYVRTIGRQFLADFYRSTPLHDIGKVGIPDQILLKPGALTYDEFEIMKQHTVIGAEALEKAAKQSRFGDFLKMAAVIARSHHEKFNGTGYPDGLCGDEIPLCARITTVADVFDALTSSRVYKEAMPCEEACALIVSQSGQQFDPAVIAAFVACYDEFVRVKAAVDEGEVGPGTPVVCAVHRFPVLEAEALLGSAAMQTAF